MSSNQDDGQDQEEVVPNFEYARFDLTDAVYGADLSYYRREERYRKALASRDNDSATSTVDLTGTKDADSNTEAVDTAAESEVGGSLPATAHKVQPATDQDGASTTQQRDVVPKKRKASMSTSDMAPNTPSTSAILGAISTPGMEPTEAGAVLIASSPWRKRYALTPRADDETVSDKIQK